jgi:hypothetical protein
MSSSIANIASLYPKVKTYLTWAWGQTWKWLKNASSQSRIPLGMSVFDKSYLLLFDWPAQIQVSLCTLPTLFGLPHAPQYCRDFLVQLYSFLATCWMVNIWSNLETHLRNQANYKVPNLLWLTQILMFQIYTLQVSAEIQTAEFWIRRWACKHLN